ncbi:MAG: PIN domain-containing protein [Acidimicrobiia bacterium]|jgi:predicted nucleic acid-binding protein|nr:PIN domain-containing protein [Acidimicrobiia bacterium]
MIDNDAAGLVDTNVVVYLHDEGEPVKRERAIEVFSDLEYELVVSSEVMSEFHVATTRKLKRPVLPADATTTIALLAQLTVVPIGPELVQSAISLSQQHQLSYWDALIVASARTGVVSSC